MNKISKVYIQNFKGVQKPAVVDFNSDELTVLNGPNGFGKTTIFDAIEICLRGKLERTVKHIDVTKKNSDHNRPFYQNQTGGDVILKVWLQDLSGGNHIVIKRLDKDNNGRINNSRAFRPDSWDLLETYYTADTNDFETAPEFSKLRRFSQKELDELFFGTSQLSLTNLYTLFNYLQQEDNIYFLRKDEESKKEELDFLFQTQVQAYQLEQITTFHKNVKSIRENVERRLDEIGEAQASKSQVQYQQLFSENIFAYDVEDPFKDVAPEHLAPLYENIVGEIAKLIEFSKNFDLREYEKDRFRLQLRYALDHNWVLPSIVLQYFLYDKNFDVLRQRFVVSEQIIRYRDKVELFEIDSDILTTLGFARTFIEELQNYTNRRALIQQQIGELGRIVRELNTSREQTIDSFTTLNSQVPQAPLCPLCNAEWANIATLIASVDEKTKALDSFNGLQSQELSDLEKFIRESFLNKILAAIDQFLSLPENSVDPAFYNQLIDRRGNLPAIERLSSLLESKNIAVKDFQLYEHVSKSKSDENVLQLRQVIEAALSGIEVNQQALIHQHLYTEIYREDATRIISVPALDNKLAYVTEKFNEAKIYSANVLNARLAKLRDLERSLTTIKRKLNGAIVQYKKAMIERIKIPFYIYSGKILQHYQQGYGIFVDVSSTTSRVRFLTDDSTDHDIIHQLSSGQLAVVSIAFCLSLNKVYDAIKDFKFLAIDDPVQTLDDLNVHSFIELMRHEFVGYQILMSTHEESICEYAMYKFRKFGFKTSAINVQKLFYNSEND